MPLQEYSGTWTPELAAHLLRRTLFGATLQQIKYAEQKGLSATVSELLAPETPTVPITTNSKEGIASLGETWVDKVFPANDPQTTQNVRNDSLAGWMIGNIANGQLSILDKMTLFWQNHFAVEAQNDARATYKYIKLLRDNALGNLVSLVKQVSVDPSMLLFLNGNSNTKNSPNENFSRELLELFTVGKGPQVGEGDYTNYTEEDIRQGARILTGWTVSGMLSSTQTTVSALFYPSRHDTGDKVLSNRLGNKTIANADQNEYANYIDVLFETDAIPHYICKKLYRWFVNYEIDTTIETEVIKPLVDLFITSNYEIKPVVEALLKSDHFYSIAMRGTIIKNPIEYIFSVFNQTESKLSYTDAVNYDLYLQSGGFAAVLGMNYFRPPNVGGWPAYYQAPTFSRLWINSSYIKLRFDFASYVTLYGGITSKVDKTKKWEVNHIGFLNGLTDPTDAVQIIEDLSLLFFPKGMSEEEKTSIKSILTNGLPDFEWTLQYNEYKANPTNATYVDPVRLRIALVLDYIFKLPQFQTI